MSILVPFAVPFPLSSMVPFADLLPTSFRHLPPVVSRTAPVAPWLGAVVTVQVNDTEPDAPPEVAVTVG
jgi:hypothetical protein